MKHATHCKFCKKPMTLEIDDSYSELGDPLKLLQYSSCNRCADLRENRRRLEDGVYRFSSTLIQSGEKIKPEDRDAIREQLIKYTKRYTALVSDWVGSSTPWWEISIVDAIMEKPKSWNSFLSQCWKMYEDKKSS